MVVTVQAVKDISIAGPVIVGIATVIRLIDRARLRKLGLDDLCAGLALCLVVVTAAAMFVRLDDPERISYTTRWSLFYLLSENFYGIIWLCRFSILFSIIRFVPPGTTLKILHYVAVSFGVVWAILLAQEFWVCEPQAGWKDTPVPQCALGRDVAIAQLITDIYADSALIFFPLRLLWKLEVSRGRRNRLVIVFMACIATTIVSIVHAVWILRVGGLEEVFIALVEEYVSLMVCNLSVLVGLAARTFDKRAKSTPFSSGSASSGSGSRYRSQNRVDLTNLSNSTSSNPKHSQQFDNTDYSGIYVQSHVERHTDGSTRKGGLGPDVYPLTPIHLDVPKQPLTRDSLDVA